MRSSFTESEIANYRSNGFLAIEDFLEPAELVRRSTTPTCHGGRSTPTTRAPSGSPLDDATVENGCLYFVPGSQRLAIVQRGDLGPDLGAVFASHPELRNAPVRARCPPAGARSTTPARSTAPAPT